MVTHLRTFTTAGAAVLALVAGAALTGSTARADDGRRPPLPVPSVQRAPIASCGGHALVQMVHRSEDTMTVPVGSNADIQGSVWLAHGPRTGSDSVLVTVAGLAYSGGPGELTSVSLWRDGKLTSEGWKYLAYNGSYDQVAVQFCARIDHGPHLLTVSVNDNGGSDSILYYPTITYERFD